MHSLHDLVLGRLATVRKDLDAVLARLDDGMLDWAPREGMRTVRGQLVEIGATEIQDQHLLRGHTHVEYPEAEAQLGDASTVEALRQGLKKVRHGTVVMIEAWSEDDLAEEIAVPHGWFESLGLHEVPRAEIFRSIALHEWYHTGQLVSYLWARGDDPYKW